MAEADALRYKIEQLEAYLMATEQFYRKQGCDAGGGQEGEESEERG